MLIKYFLIAAFRHVNKRGLVYKKNYVFIFAMFFLILSCGKKTTEPELSNRFIDVLDIILPADASLPPGDTITLPIKINPINATDKTLVWSSSDTSAAIVNAKGDITGIAYGTSRITASATDGSGKTSVCLISVTDKPGVNGGYYEIYSKKQLSWLTSNANQKEISGSGYGIKIMNDIDMTGISIDGITKFDKEFDGHGNKIIGIKIDRTGANNIGLIGTLNIGGIVKNIALENADIKGKDNAGSIVGYNNGTIENCQNIGGSVISVNSSAGGIAGYSSGTVVKSYNTADVVANTGKGLNVGGVVGWNDRGKVENCYNTGNINGIQKVGGVVGVNAGTLDKSYSIGNVIGTERVGGVLGDNGSASIDTVSYCYFLKTASINKTLKGMGSPFVNTNTDPIETLAGFGIKDTFAESGWDFGAVWEMASSLTKEPSDRPILRGSSSVNTR